MKAVRYSVVVFVLLIGVMSVSSAEGKRSVAPAGAFDINLAAGMRNTHQPVMQVPGGMQLPKDSHAHWRQPQKRVLSADETLRLHLQQAEARQVEPVKPQHTRPTLGVGQQYSVVDTLVVQSLEDTLMYVFWFNAKAYDTAATVFKWSAGAWADSEHYVYTYDANGEQLTEYDQVTYNGSWVPRYTDTTSYNAQGYTLMDRYAYYTLGVLTDGTSETNTYDANGRRLTGLVQEVSDGQWVNFDLYTNTYNANGYRLNSLTQFWEDGAWVNSSLDSETYDAHNNELTYTYEYFYGGALESGQTFMYGYDTSGRQSSFVESTVMLGSWTKTDSATYIRNANGYVILETDWSGAANAWVYMDKYIFVYDNNNDLLSSLYEVYENSTWQDSTYDTSTYDTTGRSLSDTSFVYVSGQRMNSTRDWSRYNAMGWQLAYTTQEWYNGAWVNSYYDTNAYDNEGHTTFYEYEYWINGELNGGSTSSYGYDLHGNQVSFVQTNLSDGEWVNNDSDSFTYDSQSNLLSETASSWSGSAWTEVDGNLDIEVGPGSYFYLTGYHFAVSRKTLIVTGVPVKHGNTPTVYSLKQNYPNPFNPTTNISYDLPKAGMTTLRVYDILGREVTTLVNGMQTPGAKSVSFNASAYPSGVYFYKLNSGSYSDVRKMMLVK